jgi:phage tail sheath gpL-like
MRFICAFLLAVNAGLAAEFITGQAARLVIGQTTFTAQEQGASESLLGGVSGLAYANDTLFVADANPVGADPINNRVLLFKNLSLMLPGPTDEIINTRPCPVCGGTASVVLGQLNFTETAISIPPTSQSLRRPTAVASDGVVLAVADTDANRVLIWRSIPSENRAAPDIVVGQSDFTSSAVSQPPTAASLRGPEGVWIQNGKLFVADTFNHRVLIWNSIPTSNGQRADVVLGQPNFSALPETEPVRAFTNVKATTLFSPVSVTSDGQRLYVTDLGYDRVLIWNSIPTSNQQPADIVAGQPDMTTAIPNNVKKLCQPTGEKDTAGNDIYPAMCAATLETPRYALSDGTRLFIADGGNDRVLVFNQIPAANGQNADAVLGQTSPDLNQASDDPNAFEWRRASVDSLRTPTSLAWDGTNLYVSDPFNRRVMVFTPEGESILPTGVRNSASLSIHALGTITFAGQIQEKDEITITIGEKEYKYKIIKDDTIANVIASFVGLINAGEGDPLVYATPNAAANALVLTARAEGSAGNDVAYSVTASENALLLGTAATSALERGEDAAKIAPGTLVAIMGENLADQTAVTPSDADPLPTELGGVQVYFNGIRSPLLYVSPSQINAQVPYEIQEREKATGTISLGGSVTEGGVTTVIINDREYSYTAVKGATLASIRDALVGLINSQDPEVEAFGSGDSSLLLSARVPGSEGCSIQVSGEISSGNTVTVTPLAESLRCAAVTSINAYVRIRWNDGRVTATNAVAVPIIPQNPGIYAFFGSEEPRPGVVLHYSSNSTGTISLDGAVTAGNVATVIIDDREYSYTAVQGDTLVSIRDALVGIINSQDPKVEAFPSGYYSRLRLRARIPGPEGNSIKISGHTSDDASVIVTPFNTSLCCANEGGSLVTEENPALPGETILVYATGLGFINPHEAQMAAVTGEKFKGPALNDPVVYVSAMAGAKTASVLNAGLTPGWVGVHEVHLELNTSQPTNPKTQLWIAQYVYVSNIITFAVYNPDAPAQ